MSWMGNRSAVALAAFVCVWGAASAQSAWTVKPEWVRAHESFLASDAMQGRGSATHDEEVAATYVASEFEGYGLKTAPGMSGYIQTAELVGPQLNGQARLKAGVLDAEEGGGFTLLRSTGLNVSGPLVKVKFADAKNAKVARGSVVLVTDVPPGHGMEAIGAMRRTGAAMVMVAWDAAVARSWSMMGSKTVVPLRLAESDMLAVGSNLVALNAAQMADAVSLAEGTPVSLTVTQTKAVRETYNAVGYLQGTDANAGMILLTAHLDHLGVGRPVNGDSIYNGANDDAAGTTAVLELAHALAAGPPLRRSVLFVCYGSEEIGGLGSTYFGRHSPVPLKDLVANLEFEMIGNQDPKMPKGVLLLTGWERSNLGPTLKAHGALLGPDPYPEQHFFERSDNYSLALMGVVAHTAAGLGTVPTYHQPSDDLAHLDVPFMTAAIQSLIEPVRWLATSDFVPKWNPGGEPKR